jgi:hypothetical protein
MKRYLPVRAWLFLLCLMALAPRARAAEWQTALKEQSDPVKLARLGERGANERVNRIVYYLHQAQISGTEPGVALDWAFLQNGTTGLTAALSKETLLLNCRHAVEWGLLSEPNLKRLRRGESAIITNGRYKGESIDVDHIVPVSIAPETGNSLANLEMLPASVNRSKGARVGFREMRFAARLYEAGILHKDTLWEVRWVFFSHMLPWLVFVGLLARYWCKRLKKRLRADSAESGLTP